MVNIVCDSRFGKDQGEILLSQNNTKALRINEVYYILASKDH